MQERDAWIRRKQAIDRRRFLGLMGVASLVFEPVTNTVGKWISPGFELEEGPGIVRVGIRGQPLWTIATGWFEGQPQLEVERLSEELRIRLRYAIFPGTLVSAAFEASVRRQSIGYSLDIAWDAFGQFHGDDFVQWLKGEASLSAPVPEGIAFLKEAGSGALRLGAHAKGTFHPDWSFSFEGDPGAVLTYKGRDFSGRRLSLVLNTPNSQSPLSGVALDKETLLELHPDSGAFDLLESDLFCGQNLAVNPALFSTIFVETGQDIRGRDSLFFYQQQSAESAAGAQFVPDLDLGEGQVIPLKRLHFARSFSGSHSEFALFGSLAGPIPLTLNGNRFDLEPATAGRLPDFELSGKGDAINRVVFAPHVGALSHPIVQSQPLAMQFPKRQRLLVKGEGVNENTIDGKPALVLDSGDGAFVALAGNQVLLPLLRTEDMVLLLFHFFNFQWDLQRNTLKRVGNKDAAVAVYFPPQSIAEEVVQENSTSPRFGPDFHLPLDYRMAGLSRLVFRIPEQVQEIENNAEALLNWSAYTMMIHPRGRFDTITEPGNIPKKPAEKDFAVPKDLLDAVVLKDQGQEEPARPEVAPPGQRPPRTVDAPIAPAETEENTLADIVAGGFVIPPVVAIDPELFLKDSYRTPRPFHTAIEAPFRMYLSPHEKLGWEHKTAGAPNPAQNALPFAKNTDALSGKQVYELWHTRSVEKQPSGGKSKYLDLDYRALWAKDANESVDHLPDPVSPESGRLIRVDREPDPSENRAGSEDSPNPEKLPFISSLSANDRHKLVHLTSDYDLEYDNGKKYYPETLKVDLLLLSALGAYLDLEGEWPFNSPGPLNIMRWVHRSTLGRDHYVQVAYAGYLMPFGHQAALIKVTSRRVMSEKDPVFKKQIRDGGNLAKAKDALHGAAALNFQRFYIVVKQPVKTYPAFGSQAGTEKIPFKQVELLTKRTPVLDLPLSAHELYTVGEDGDQGAFWAYSGGSPFQFRVAATDLEGRVVTFRLPMVFVNRDIAEQRDSRADKLSLIINAFRGYNREEFRSAKLGSQLMALAPPHLDKPEGTAFETKRLIFSAIGNPNSGDPRFFPILEEARIYHTAINELTGQGAVIDVTPFYVEIDNGGKVFAKLVKSLPLDFGASGSDKTGGILTPNLNITALSKTLGPIGGNFNGALPPMSKNTMDPGDFFGDMGNLLPKLFGSIKLTDILKLDNVAPNLLRTVKDKKIILNYDWKPKVAEFGDKDTMVWFSAPEKGLVISVQMKKDLEDTGDPDITLDGTLRNFFIQLFQIIRLDFKEIGFYAKPGEKLDVFCDFKGITFVGPLEFVNVLQKVIDPGGFVDPPILDVYPDRVEVGYDLALPATTVGIFSLRNIKLKALLTLPFIGYDPLTFNFRFCERNDPFAMSVAIYGGGGYLGLTVSPDGLKQIESAMEFGASFALNVGVASGSVKAVGGFYFSCELTGDGQSMVFESYLHIEGNLRVIRLISATLTFHLAMGFKSDGDFSTLYGEATVIVKVDVVLFSGEVEVTASRSISQCDAPTFSTSIEEADWIAYAKAFA